MGLLRFGSLEMSGSKTNRRMGVLGSLVAFTVPGGIATTNPVGPTGLVRGYKLYEKMESTNHLSILAKIDSFTSSYPHRHIRL